MMEVGGNLDRIKAQLPDGVVVVAVTKTRTTDEIMALYETGHRLFGENRIQELVAKQAVLPGDIEWHMVGHLQRNKVKYIAPFISLIHSVDSGKLLTVINKEAAKNERVINCLLQIHIATEETKFGFSSEEVKSFLSGYSRDVYPNVRIKGLMGMATFTSNMQQVRSEFKYLSALFDEIKRDYFVDDPGFKELSMGMSGDFIIAAEEGSTMVRIGSLIFGET